MGKIHINNFACRLRLCGLASEYLVDWITFQSTIHTTLVEALRFKILLYIRFLFTGICYNGIYFCIPPYRFNL